MLKGQLARWLVSGQQFAIHYRLVNPIMRSCILWSHILTGILATLKPNHPT